MSSFHALKLPASPLGFGLPGSWTLARDRAVTLDARQAGFLRIAHGAVWATFDGPQLGPANDWGDVVLISGARIHLTPGQQVVLESFAPAANEDACFSWEPDADAVVRDAAAPLSGWRTIAANWTATLGGRLRRWLRMSTRWAPLSPDAFTEAKAQAAQRLRYLTISQP